MGTHPIFESDFDCLTEMSHRLRVAGQPATEYALTGRVVISADSIVGGAATKYLKLGPYYFSTEVEKAGKNKIGRDEVGLSGVQREFLGVQEAVEINAQVVQPDPNQTLHQVKFEIDFYSKKGPKTEFSADEMETHLQESYDGLILQKGNRMPFKFKSTFFLIVVTEIKCMKLGQGGKVTPVDASYGIWNKRTSVRFARKADSQLNLAGRAVSMESNIINPDFDFSKVGIGGLDDEFKEIFRRAFASRIFPADIVKKMGGKHVRGILLFGPPGCGKTLIARSIGKLLSTREPKVVNGPEILNKYVGECEANIRKLFLEAEEEQAKRGDTSGLHIIILDELDAICKQRGASGSSTGVHDTVVNQLLSKIDGVNSLNNVLIIGMTNRPDLIDDALKRPGRLEVHKEIGLPSEAGRLQIFEIHTKKMRENGLLATDVDLAQLSEKTKNFSGAEIEGLVRAAQSCAFNRCTNAGTKVGVDEEKIKNIKVEQNDFDYAFKNDIKPAFGVKDTKLQQFIVNGIVNWSAKIDKIMRDGRDLTQTAAQGKRTPMVTALIEGSVGAGKTALAAKIALEANFPCVRLITPQSLVHHGESGKCGEIVKAFEEAHKSTSAVIVVDEIERLLDYNPIGPRFSNLVCQTLLVQLRQMPPKGRRCLVIATSSKKDVLEQMGLLGCFDKIIHTPCLRTADDVVQALRGLEGDVPERQLDIIQRNISTRQLTVPIKRLIHFAGVAETTSPSDQFGEKLIQLLEEDNFLSDAHY